MDLNDPGKRGGKGNEKSRRVMVRGKSETKDKIIELRKE
jgi:hypothetical protein